jgi:polyhydroxyalkanoate synthesis regulator phasin
MLDLVRTLLLAAAGAVDLTDDKLRSLTEELVRRGSLARDEAKAVVAEWATAAERRQRATEERLEAAVEDALGRHNVASHVSVVELQARVAGLEEAVRQLLDRRSAM